MNLFLHWLRWDLRRFRWLLLAWTALLAVYSLFLWHLNAHVLTADPALLKCSEFIAAALGLAELFMLLLIFRADPAAGTSPFWKSRPPVGWAVGAAKLIIALTFFLLLPALCWWAVLHASGVAGQESYAWGGISWMSFLVWVNAGLIAVLALGAAAARSGISLVERLIVAGVVFIVMAVIFVRSVPSQPGAHDLPGQVKLEDHLARIAIDPRAALIWLAAGAAVYLLCRRRPSQGRGKWAHLYVPVLAFGSGALLPLKEKEVRPGPHPQPDQFSALQLSQPRLRDGARLENRRHMGNGGTGRQHWCLTLRYRLTGLPQDCMAFGQWQELRLITADGRTLQALCGDYFHTGSFDAVTGVMTASGAWFADQDVAPLSMQPCRAEGTLRINISRRHERTIPFQPGAVAVLPGGTVHVMERTEAPTLNDPIFHCRFCRFLSGRMQHMIEPWLHHGPENLRLPLRVDSAGVRSGYFVQLSPGDWMVKPGLDAPALTAARYRRDAAAGAVDQWRFGFSWYEPEGWIERPVKIDLLVIPRQQGDERGFAAVYDALHLPPGAGKEEVRRQVMRALGLMDACRQQPSGPADKDPLYEAAHRFMAKVPREHLDVLLRIADEERPDQSNYTNPMDLPLRRRIGELVTAEDVPAIRQKPRLFRDLRFELQKRGFISYSEAHGPDWPELSDAELLRKWQRGYEDRDVPVSALTEAMRRGLSWVPGALRDVAELACESYHLREAVTVMAKLSDCPADPAAGISWLQKNAARITWDAEAKRWVLPAP